MRRSQPVSRPQKSTTVRTRTTHTVLRSGLRLGHRLPGDPGAALAERLFTSPRRHTRPAREATMLATAERLSIDVVTRVSGRDRARRLAAWRWGHGPTVLLVHGWEGRGAQLGAVIEPLVDAGYSVLTFDAPAHGDSPGDRLVLADMAASVRAAESAAGGLHGIVAHLFGALSSTLALSRGVDARRVVYIAPATLVSRAVDNFARITGVPEVVDGMVARLTRLNGFHPDDVVPERLAPRIDASLLALHDTDDDEVPHADAARLVAAWPDAELVTTSGLGHRRILRDPAVVARAVAFLTDGVTATVEPTPGRRPFVDAWVAPISPERLAAMPR